MHLVPHSFFHCSPDISPIKYWQIKWEKSISGPWLRKPSIWLSRLNLAVTNGMIQRKGVRDLNISMIHENGTSWKKSIKCKKTNTTGKFHTFVSRTLPNIQQCWALRKCKISEEWSWAPRQIFHNTMSHIHNLPGRGARRNSQENPWVEYSFDSKVLYQSV